MTQHLLLALVELLVVLPIIFLFRNKEADLVKIVGILSLYHLIYVVLLFLPIEYAALSIPNSSMNWAGKIMTIVFSIVFYYLNKEKIEKHFRLFQRPARGKLKKVIIVGLLTVAVMCALTVLFSKNKPMELEKLAYQLTMPGLDEELWRGIFIGLLLLLVKDMKFKLGHPIIWITTIVFALAHSLYFQDWSLGFAADAFLVTGALGYILGWMTLYSKSIWPALIFHNVINFSTNFLEMVIL